MTAQFRARSFLLAVFVACISAIVATAAHAQRGAPNGSAWRERNQPAVPAPTAPAGRSGITPRARVIFTAEREAAALTFARDNRPELPAVLEDLKARQPAEYQRAICDLFWTSEMLTGIRQDDPKRHELALRTWQLESLANLQAARLPVAKDNVEQLQSELEQTVEQLVAAQLDESAYVVRRQEAQLKRAKDRQKRLEERRAELVQERLGSMLQMVKSAPQAPVKSTP